MVRKQGTPCSTWHQHVELRPSRKCSTSTSLSAAGIHTRKANDALLCNSQYAGHISLPAVFLRILQYFTAMTQEQCQTIMDLRDPPTAEDHDNDWEMLDD